MPLDNIYYNMASPDTQLKFDTLVGDILNTTPLSEYYTPSSTINNTSTNPSDNSWLSTLGIAGLGLNAGLGLFNAYNSYQALQMAKDQYKFQKRLANRNIANQAKTINNMYDNAAQVALGMRGSANGLIDPSLRAQYEDRARRQYVDGSSI